jgi:AraC-like DNA-binding protein
MPRAIQPIIESRFVPIRFLRGYHHRHSGDAQLHWNNEKPRLKWPGWLVYVTLAGRMTARGPWGVIELNHQRVACLRLSEHHYYLDQHPGSALELVWMHFTTEPDVPDLLPALCEPEDPQLVHRLAGRCFDARRAAATKALPMRRADAWIGALVDELVYRSRPCADMGQVTDEPISALQQRLSANPERAWDFAAEASALKIPYSSFFKRFARRVGEGPREHLARLRIAEACKRLRETNDTLDRIAQAVGYANRSLLNRIFTRIVGRSPTDYRRQVLGR